MRHIHSWIDTVIKEVGVPPQELDAEENTGIKVSGNGQSLQLMTSEISPSDGGVSVQHR